MPGRRPRGNQFVALAVSATLIAGGVALYWAGYRQSRAARTTAWAPMIGRGLAGIAVTGALP